MKKIGLVVFILFASGCMATRPKETIQNVKKRTQQVCTNTDVLIQVQEDIFRRVAFCLMDDGTVNWQLGRFVHKPKKPPVGKKEVPSDGEGSKE